jgi:acyl-CoA reductase-like NAD-dependent aldehyde dehydrogenase
VTQTNAAPAGPAMSGAAQSKRETPIADLDRAVQAVREKAVEFARLPISKKLELLRASMAGVERVAADWVRAGCQAKGLSVTSHASGEEWLAGPTVTMRNMRLMAESLEAIRTQGKPPLGTGHRVRPDGRLEIDVFPASLQESALFAGFKAHCLMLPGVDVKAAREQQAAFFGLREPQGVVEVVLGAGNVSSIPACDVVWKMFAEGHVCVLKMNPVNEWVGPHLEQALKPLIDPGYLRVVYGGAAVGTHLVNHPQVDEVHITGSDKTHDAIVWGPAGPERERRKAAKDPLLKKRITSELGNVSPVAIVPGEYTDAELEFQAHNIASMVANNGSFNCNAGKVLLTGKGWKQRDAFLGKLRRVLGTIPVREAYYPGAFDRYESLLGGRTTVERFGTGTRTALAWAFVPGLDPDDKGELLYQVEPFCGVISETSIASADPVAFLAAATTFMNDRLWGTLNAAIVISPRDEAKGEVAAALDRAVVELRYGTVAINHWPALGYGLITPPWGGHPSATLENVQSGLGWVHNTFLLAGVDKSVVRGPITVWPKPAWFHDNAQAHEIGRRLVSFELEPSWLKIPGIAFAALRG